MKNKLLEAGYSSNTIVTYLYWINKYLEFAKFQDETIDTGIYKYIEYCKMNYSVPTQKVILSSLHLLMSHLKPTVKFEFKLPKSNWIVRTPIVTKEEYLYWQGNLIHNDIFISVRDRNILKILWNTGIRIGELIDLKWGNISDGYLWIRSKNNKDRQIPFNNGLFEELKQIKNSEYVFASRNGNKLSYSFMYQLIKKISSDRLSPHSFRHSFATRLLKNGVPLNYVSQLLGHSNLNTTLIYLHTTMDDIREELLKKDWH